MLAADAFAGTNVPAGTFTSTEPGVTVDPAGAFAFTQAQAPPMVPVWPSRVHVAEQ